jgi:hypothetical protein
VTKRLEVLTEQLVGHAESQVLGSREDDVISE